MRDPQQPLAGVPHLLLRAYDRAYISSDRVFRGLDCQFRVHREAEQPSC